MSLINILQHAAVATVGYSIGLDSELFRNVAAALMIAVGVILLVPRFQEPLLAR
jgi:hypothetical protein